jgi:hypothetical protein
VWEIVRALEHASDADGQGRTPGRGLERIVDGRVLPLRWQPQVRVYRPAPTPTQWGLGENPAPGPRIRAL